MNNVLFVGAHPDDIEIGAGGTLLRHKQIGDNIFILVVTKGEVGRGKVKCENARIGELMNAMNYVGIPQENIIMLDMKDTLVFKDRDKLFNKIEKLCNEKKIHRVYAHTRKDYHQDHVTIFNETMRAARNVPEIMAYETNSSSLSNFSPNHFVDISNIVDEKLRLLKFHKSQLSKSTMSDEVMTSAAKFRGSQSRVFKYAEGFEVIRTVTRDGDSCV